MHEESPYRIAASELDPDTPGVEVAETHVSTLTFVGSLVHKRKKHVHFDFIDLSTPERRENICRRELELNRRFSLDVYLGLEEITDDGGNVIDHAVLMRRMPVDRRLSTLAAQHDDVSACVRAVARSIATCHADSESTAEIGAVATPDALRALWEANLSEMEVSVKAVADPAELASLRELARRYLDGRSVLFDKRIAQGLIVDGHGDLLADDIYCLDDGPRILDCLEFDDRLRYGDVLYDIGFLAMDLEHLDRPDLASALLDWYAEFSGERHPASLAHHYIAYRASVRAKVSLLKGESYHADALAFLAQCRQHLAAAQVHLVVIGGLPGTGKTTLAMAIGDAFGWPVLRSDEIRKELAGVASTAHASAPYGEGLYTAAMTEATYRELLARAAELISRGESVIVDASFSTADWRTAAGDVARNGHADLTELRCVVPADVAAARLRQRALDGSDASDADEAVADEMAQHFDPWDDAIAVDTSRSLDEVVPAALDRITIAHHIRGQS